MPTATDAERVPDLIEGYASPSKRPPLLAYAVTVGVFNALFAAALLVARRSGGELLVCPYCLDLWVVAGFSLGLLFAPRLTRFLASVFSALTISDFLQIAYRAAEEKGLG